MEISYYFECFKVFEDSRGSDLECLTLNAISAEFKFDMQFIDDYNYLRSEKSKQLWFQVQKSLKQSFGTIEIDFALKEIVKGSVKILVEMNPLRDGSAEDVKMLLENNDETCKKILGNDESTFGTGCWTQNTKAVFAKNDFVFLGVGRVETLMQAPTKHQRSQ